jgi:hypothetical protein
VFFAGFLGCFFSSLRLRDDIPFNFLTVLVQSMIDTHYPCLSRRLTFATAPRCTFAHPFRHFVFFCSIISRIKTIVAYWRTYHFWYTFRWMMTHNTSKKCICDAQILEIWSCLLKIFNYGTIDVWYIHYIPMYDIGMSIRPWKHRCSKWQDGGNVCCSFSIRLETLSRVNGSLVLTTYTSIYTK